MTDLQLQAIAELRDAGYAVAVFSPDELEGLTPKSIENVCVNAANEAIEDLA